MDKKIVQVDAEKINLEEKHALLLSQISSAENKFIETCNVKKAVDKQIEALTEEKLSLESQKAELEKEIADFTVLKEKMQVNHDKFVVSFTDKEEVLNQEFSTIKQSLIDLEAKKKPILIALGSLDLQKKNAEKELDAVLVELENTHIELAKIKASITSESKVLGSIILEIKTKSEELILLGDKKAEHEDYVARMHTSNEIISANKTKIEVQEAQMAKLRNDIALAQEDLSKVTIEHGAKTEEIDGKIRTLALLETRVDAKLEIFQAYRDKFTVDELAQMKINPNIEK